MSQASDKTVTENGKILVNVLNKLNGSEVKETLMSTFSDNFCLEKLIPRITITNVPNDMTFEALVTKTCDKDAFLNSDKKMMLLFSVINSWRSKG